MPAHTPVAQRVSRRVRDDLRRPKDLAPTPHGFRPDIEGLRAVAVVAVLLYHAGLPLFAGGYVGVDVFFVISGFLITGLLVKELDRTGRISLRNFYARRIRRLLPAAVVVLVVVSVLSWNLFSPVQRYEVSGDIASAGLYVVNWRLAAQAVNYFAADAYTNPVQHFWSLAVEEQFYLFWPALLLAAAWLYWKWLGPRLRLAQRYGHKAILLAAIVLVGLASFGYSLYATYRGSEDAYFSTFTRVWELALGSALALVIARLPAMRPWAVRALGLAGLGAIIWACVRYDDQTAFPGAAALLPALGAFALIVAGAYDAGGTRSVLTWAPARHIGKISYSWYLWHWPVIVFAAEYWGDLSVAQGLVVAAFSYVPAVVSYRFVEEPFRRSRQFEQRPRWAWRLAFGCTAMALSAGLVLQVSLPVSQVPREQDVVGAEAVRESTKLQSSARGVLPDPLEAKDDVSKINDDGCQVPPPETEVPDCVYGNPDADTTVVTFGDSHMMQYGPAFEALADEHDWRLVVLVKSGCSPSNTTLHSQNLKRQYVECDEWREKAVDRIADEDPDLVISTGRATTPVMEDGERLNGADREDALEDGWVDTLERLHDRTDAEIAVIRDNPQMDEDVPGCVSKSMAKLKDCAIPEEQALSYEPVEVNAAEQVEDTRVVDLTPVMCPDGMCPAVIGNAIVYRDTEHLTATFVETLPRWIEEQLPGPL